MAETLRDRIRNRLDETGMSPEEASRKAGLDKTYLRKLFERPASQPGAETLRKLADALDTTTAALLGEAKPQPIVTDVRGAAVAVPPLTAMPNDLPVRGTAAGSHLRGAFELEPGIVDWVRRPPALAGAANAYALYIEGTSMVPEHNPGDLRIVHPDRPPRIGDSVIVQVRISRDAAIEATIGHLLRRTERAVIIGKLNPKAEVELKRETVVAIHKVLTLNELFGV